LSIPEVVNQVAKEKGDAFLKCPIHGVSYILNPNSAKWSQSNKTDEVAIFCPQRHHGRILAANFRGATPPAKERPEWSIQP
jgi:hypothetical protein